MFQYAVATPTFIREVVLCIKILATSRNPLDCKIYANYPNNSIDKRKMRQIEISALVTKAFTMHQKIEVTCNTKSLSGSCSGFLCLILSLENSRLTLKCNKGMIRPHKDYPSIFSLSEAQAVTSSL